MEQLWYSTLTTIIQALAALFALSATFLVFQLEVLNKQLRQYRIRAIQTMSYLDRSYVSRHVKLSLLEVLTIFKEHVGKLSGEACLGIGPSNFSNVINTWEYRADGHGMDPYGKEFAENFLVVLNDELQAFESKFWYRYKLWCWAMLTGGLITATILCGLAMLSGMSHPFNILHMPATTSIYLITAVTSACILLVFWTIGYAVFGDKY